MKLYSACGQNDYSFHSSETVVSLIHLYVKEYGALYVFYVRTWSSDVFIRSFIVVMLCYGDALLSVVVCPLAGLQGLRCGRVWFARLSVD